MNVTVVIASTRPGRVGEPIAKWFLERAKKHGAFEIVVADLKEIALPHLDEPQHPRFQKYEHEHTKRWAAIVAAADAYVFVTPEYNFSAPPALLNAFDFVYKEWNYKPAGFVSYGGVSGGLRSVQMTKQTLTAMKVMPLPEAVTIPFAAKLMKDGVFQGSDDLEKAIKPMLDELHKWAVALKTLR
ncbi:MAG TPA: NAD(P)H-dependent oxidoreductase [Polyangiaceae bacterium]|jgi:NAD(P)H-dependent FMN reductase